jgi:pimeloyl-ACP methyl ester carboxylesterase
MIDHPNRNAFNKIVIPVEIEETSALFRSVEGSKSAMLWAGAWFSEAHTHGIAIDVSDSLASQGVSSMLLRYRKSRELPASIRDTQAAAAHLIEQGFERIALVGHSFSGAVVISAGPKFDAIVAVAALASQTFGAATVASLSPRPLLLIHGTEDTRLSPYCSEQIYSWAKRPKELRFIDGATHGLTEYKDEVSQILTTWLLKNLKAGN